MPILLGSFLLAAHVPDAGRLYGIVVVVVVFSVVVQGSLTPAAAPAAHLPMRDRTQAMGARGRAARWAQRRALAHHQARLTCRRRTMPGLPGDAWISFIVRGGQLVPITADTRLQAADDVLVLAPPDVREKLTAAF